MTENSQTEDNTVEVMLAFVKETKATYRLEEINEDGSFKSFGDSVIGTLYLKKANFPEHPRKVKVTVTTLR